jgi:hypothetical protein
MRTVIVGSDFMYDKNGVLRPIEINTAIGWHRHKMEEDSVSFDLTELKEFVLQNNFSKIIYLGTHEYFSERFLQLTDELNIDYEFIPVDLNSFSVPYVEDSDEVLIIRTAYDNSAVVDYEYCRDKITYLELIKNQPFGSQFAYKNDNTELVNYISEINDNGDNPNFILKYRYPQYNKEIYPKLYKINNQEELQSLLQSLPEDYFLMEFLYNEDKLVDNHIQVKRSLNLLFPPDLQSIPIGLYTIFCNDTIDTPNQYDQGNQLVLGRKKYLTNDLPIKLPKLQDGDLVMMADGTYKSAEELQIGDEIRTIDIPNPFNVYSGNELVNYKINFEELQTGSTFSTNRITNKQRVNLFCNIVKIKFTDGTDWLDTEGSKYLSIKDDEVRFLILNTSQRVNSKFSVQNGDSIILVDTSDINNTQFVEKVVESIETSSEFFGGWEITVEREHLFLTKSSLEDDISFVAIEHNVGCFLFFGCTYYPEECFKSSEPFCCSSTSTCVSSCGLCPAEL